MTQPLLSIVIPVYNTEKYLGKAVESALSQGFSDFELLLVDDGSTDSCPAIIDAYARKDPRVRAFHKPNGGTYTGYNRGIEEALGKYIIFASSDDLFDPQALQIIADQSDAYDYDIIFMNVVTHTCDAEQNIIIRNVQGSAMQSGFRVLGKKEIEQRWVDFMRLGLVRNPVNAYKAAIVKKHRFRTDVYGADFLMNIALADDITSASCHPANLYHGFLYTSIKNESFNVSTGKFNAYEHDMFNEFYLRYKALFTSWNLLEKAQISTLTDLRLTSLDTELDNLSAWNNKLSYWENIARLASYFDDVLTEVCAIMGNRADVEKKLLTACQAQLAQAKAQRMRNKGKEHPIVQLMEAPGRSEKTLQARGEAMLDALFTEENPYHIGLTLYESFCAQYPAAADRVALGYLQTVEQARAHILTGQYALAAEELGQLFEMPIQEPEEFLLLALNCRALGFTEDAQAAFALGLDKFPGYPRLRELAT